jgi:hypothetical protein
MLRILSLSNAQWAASFDIDEYMAPDEDRRAAMRRFSGKSRADQTFDFINFKRRNSLKLSWLNFRLQKTDNASRALSRVVLRGERPALQHPDGTSRVCYEFPKRDTQGKVALHCNTGLGFSIHAGYQLPVQKAGLDKWTRGAHIVSRKVRTWHPRLGGSLSRCEFVP